MSIDNSHKISDVKVMLKVGADGSGISSIEKTGTSGLVDTYTITLSTGAKYTFTVTNGKSIDNIAKTGTTGLVDTYTITYNDGTISTFTITNGNGITSIEKTGTVGAVDTYTIYFDNGDTSTFTVTNGAGGTLASLADVDINNPVAGQVLKFNGTDWENDVGTDPALADNVEAILDVYGAKNFIPYPYYETTKADSGITFTDVGDGTVTASGSLSASAEQATFCLGYPNVISKSGTYILSGVPSGYGHDVFINAVLHNPSTGTHTNYIAYDDAPATIEIPDGQYISSMYLWVKTSLASTITFSPMFRDSRITDDTWVPYAMTNRDLTKYMGSGTIQRTDNTSLFTFNSETVTEYVGKLGYINIFVTTNSSISANVWQTVLTLSDHLPKFKVRSFVMDGGNYNQDYRAQLLPTGEFQIRYTSNISSNTVIVGSLAYLIN